MIATAPADMIKHITLKAQDLHPIFFPDSKNRRAITNPAKRNPAAVCQMSPLLIGQRGRDISNCWRRQGSDNQQGCSKRSQHLEYWPSGRSSLLENTVGVNHRYFKQNQYCRARSPLPPHRAGLATGPTIENDHQGIRASVRSSAERRQ